jgi:hypothetical protein
MSTPIETEDIALSVLSKLRQFKPLSVSASRSVLVSDFGRTLFIGEEAYIVTLQSLDRSGIIRFVRNNGGKIHFGDQTVFDCNEFEDLTHDELESYDLDLSYFQYIDLIYNHTESRWYLHRQPRTISPESVDDISGPSQLANKYPLYNSAGTLFSGGFYTLKSIDNLNAFYGPGQDGAIWMAIGSLVGNFDILPPANIIGNNIVTYPPEPTENGFASYILTCKTDGYANDAAAAVGGVAVGYPYFNSSTSSFKIRMA